MTTHTKPRAASSALVPGISLFCEMGRRDDYPRWRVRATAMVDGEQRGRSWSPLRHGLQAALEEACRWRLEHVPDAAGSADELAREARAAIPRETLRRMRKAGVIE